jgi:hypothetical protein
MRECERERVKMLPDYRLNEKAVLEVVGLLMKDKLCELF